MRSPDAKVLVPGNASKEGPGVYFQLPKARVWGPAAPGSAQQVKRGNWQLWPARSINMEDPEGLQAMFQKKGFQPDIDETWAPLPEFAKRLQREEMTEWSSQGEAPWTNMDPWGQECTSQATHVIGFAVGYQGLVGFNRSTTDLRKDFGFVGFDGALEPPLARPPPDASWDGSELRGRQSAASTGQPSSSAGQ